LKSLEANPALFHSGLGGLAQLLQAVLKKGALFRFRAKGFSMSPFIRDDDVVTVAPLSRNSTRLGDVVAFVSPYTERLTVHRIVGRKGNSYLTQGDRAPESDGLISNIHILGRVTKVERNGKGVLLGLGPERSLIAFLARKGYFAHLLVPIWRRIRPGTRR